METRKVAQRMMFHQEHLHNWFSHVRVIVVWWRNGRLWQEIQIKAGASILPLSVFDRTEYCFLIFTWIYHYFSPLTWGRRKKDNELLVLYVSLKWYLCYIFDFNLQHPDNYNEIINYNWSSTKAAKALLPDFLQSANLHFRETCRAIHTLWRNLLHLFGP